jgi:hypothetical protein
VQLCRLDVFALVRTAETMLPSQNWVPKLTTRQFRAKPDAELRKLPYVVIGIEFSNS